MALNSSECAVPFYGGGRSDHPYGKHGFAFLLPGQCEACLTSFIPWKLMAEIQGDPFAGNRTRVPSPTNSLY